MLWHNDCPRFAPGDFADRPGVVTPHDELVLAGDGIRIDLPVALMERAATTGWSAANRSARAISASAAMRCRPCRTGPLGASESARRSRKAASTMSRIADLSVATGRRRHPFRGASVASMVRATSDVPRGRAGRHRRRAAPVATPPERQLVRVRGQRRHPKPTGRRLGSGTRNWSLGAAKAAPCTSVPATCPHLGADLATGTVDCGALICPWHGLRLGRRTANSVGGLIRRTTTACWPGCAWTASAVRLPTDASGALRRVRTAPECTP